jgi:hypothetical protein
MTSRAVTITLELRLAGDELDGRATDGSDERPFSGWLGLLVAIDAMLATAPDEHRDPRVSPSGRIPAREPGPLGQRSP